VRLDGILDFLGGRVFSAGIATAIVTASNATADDEHRVVVEYALDFPRVRAALEAGRPLADAATRVSVLQASLHGEDWGLSPYQESVFAEIDRHPTLRDRDVLVGKGMETGLNAAFVLDRAALDALGLDPDGPLVRPLATNRNLAAYRIVPLDEFVLWVEDTPFDDLPASVRRHLEAHRPALEARAAFRRGNCEWFRFTWPLHADQLHMARLMHSYRAGTNGFAVDASGRWLGLTNTTHVFVDEADDPYALAVLLNSPVAEFRHRTLGGIGKATSTGMYEYFANQLDRWPVPVLDDAARTALGGVGRRLHALYATAGERSAALEHVWTAVPSAPRPLAAFADPAGPYADVVEVSGQHVDEVGFLYGLQVEVVGRTMRVSGEVAPDDETDRVRRPIFELTSPDPDLFEVVVHAAYGAVQPGSALARRARLTPGAAPTNVFETALNVLTLRDFDAEDPVRNLAVIRSLVGRVSQPAVRLPDILDELRAARTVAVDLAYRAYGVEPWRDEIEAALALVT